MSLASAVVGVGNIKKGREILTSSKRRQENSVAAREGGSRATCFCVSTQSELSKRLIIAQMVGQTVHLSKAGVISSPSLYS